MIIKHQKYLKKQKCQEIYDQHTNNKNQDHISSEFGQFLTDEELAQFSSIQFILSI